MASNHGWGQQSTGSGAPRHNGWMSTFLRADAERQVMLLTRLADRLDAKLESMAPGVLPDEEWARIARLRLDAYRTLATLELEHAKMLLLAQRTAERAPMSDDEYQRQLQALGRDAVQALPPAERAQTLSSEELEAELARRRALHSGQRQTDVGG